MAAEDRLTGIWMDSDKAILVHMEGVVEVVEHVESGVEHGNPKGGYGSATHYLGQDAMAEGRLEERKKHQMKGYFKELAGKLEGTDHIVVFGPAEAKLEFRKFAMEHHTLKNKIMGVHTADSMTENQVKAWVRDFYRENISS